MTSEMESASQHGSQADDLRLPRPGAELMRLAARRRNLFIAIGLAMANHITIIAALATAAFLLRHPLQPTDALLIALCALAIGRSLRAFECLVHEASHYNWSKRHRRLNDELANVLVALPVFNLVRAYRRSHHVHHIRYGTEEDPDRLRHTTFGFRSLCRDRLMASTIKLVSMLPRYQVDWFATTGSSKALLAAGTVYHLAKVCLATLAICALSRQAFAPTFIHALLVMYFSILIVWPTIRLLGESAEHIYNPRPSGDRGRYLVGSTISNVGLLQTLLIHPHGDGMHLAHHLFPYVPGWHLRHLDAQLCRDAEIGVLRRYRRRLWEEPRRHSAAS